MPELVKRFKKINQNKKTADLKKSKNFKKENYKKIEQREKWKIIKKAVILRVSQPEIKNKYTDQSLFVFNIVFLLYYITLFTSREEKK